MKHDRSRIVKDDDKRKKMKIDQIVETHETNQVKHSYTTKGPYPGDER